MMNIRVAAVGTSSTGKSALLNALFGTAFPVDPRAGSTGIPNRAAVNFEGSDLEVTDTPPLSNQELAIDADVFLLVCDKDMTQAEYQAAASIARAGRQLVVVLNKADTYPEHERWQLISHVSERLERLLSEPRIVACAADPVRVRDTIRPDGSMVEHFSRTPPEIAEVLPALRRAIETARHSLRVQTREYAREAAVLVRSAANFSWNKLRGREPV